MTAVPDGAALEPGFSVTAQIPCGSAEILAASVPGDIRIGLRKDPGGDFDGHYHFRITGAKGRPCRVTFVDAVALSSGFAALVARRGGKADGPWSDTGPCLSHDRQTWARIHGEIIGTDYVVSFTPEFDISYLAQWAPYSLDRELDFMARLQLSGRVRCGSLGRTLGGADIDHVMVGSPDTAKRQCWLIGRQHPSETMSGFFMEGLLTRLADPADPVVAHLLERAVIHLVPNINPDGSSGAFTRLNGGSADLNRSWDNPDPAVSPEVWWVQQRMQATGVDFCLDCHGDEELRCVFLAGPLKPPHGSARQNRLFGIFEHAWAAASPDYEPGQPYPGGEPTTARTSSAWHWVAHRFDCLSVLLEQPFKDTSCTPQPATGWSPQRAAMLGHTFVDALAGVVEDLR
jgi:murein tripeptide amidase MpaA